MNENKVVVSGDRIKDQFMSSRLFGLDNGTMMERSSRWVWVVDRGLSYYGSS